MKIYEWNIGMAATIPSNNGYALKSWIIDEIIKDDPDCIVLTEFVVSSGIDYFLEKFEKNNYHWFISSTTKKNGILIALKETTFDFHDTFDYKNSFVNGNEVLTGRDLPDFYEIRVKWEENLLSIIGIRIRKDINNQNPSFKSNQFKSLDDYLSNISHNAICIGDFNAFWASCWSTDKNTTLPKTAVKSYTLHTPIYGYSYVQPNGDKNQLDHLITNIKNKNIVVNYDWSFINSLRYKAGVSADTANKSNGLPDHAILKVEITEKSD